MNDNTSNGDEGNYYSIITDTRNATDNVDVFLKEGSKNNITELNTMTYRMKKSNIQKYDEDQNTDDMNITGIGIGNLFMADCSVVLTAAHVVQENLQININSDEIKRIKYFLYINNTNNNDSDIVMKNSFFYISDISQINNIDKNNFYYNLNYMGIEDSIQGKWVNDDDLETLISKNIDNLIDDTKNTINIFQTKGEINQYFNFFF